MKVSVTKDSKRAVRLYELDAMKKLIASCKEDESTVTEYAEMAVRMVGDRDNEWCDTKVFEATAEIAKNSRIWNFYFDGSEHLDVYINATAKSGNSFYVIGIYLSDVYQIGQTDVNKEIIQRMFIRRFKEA